MLPFLDSSEGQEPDGCKFNVLYSESKKVLDVTPNTLKHHNNMIFRLLRFNM